MIYGASVGNSEFRAPESDPAGKTATSPKKLEWVSFSVVGLVWLIFGMVLSYFLTKADAHPWVSVRWMLWLWLLVMADLVSLTGFMSGMFDWKSDTRKNQFSLIIRTSSWGAIKLACLGLLGMVLYSAKEIPAAPLLLGLSTMVVVPVVGGLIAKTD